MLAWIFFSCWHEFFYFKKFMLAWIFSKPLVSISNTIFGSPDQPRPPPLSLLGWHTPITLTRPCYYTRVGRKCLPTGNKCQISQQYCGSNKLCRSKTDQLSKTKLKFPLNRECLWLWLIFAMYFHWGELSYLSCIFYERSSHHCCILLSSRKFLWAEELKS